MSVRAYLLLAFLALSCAPVRADDCNNAADQRTMDECAGQSFKKSDAELNAVYKQILQRLKDRADARALLTAAQRAWLTLRDAECKFSSSGVEGGSVYPMIYAMCLDGATKQRTAALKAYLDCKEGDTSCPVPGSP